MSEMTLDELTRICGCFNSESSVNNYYNCSHPECGETEYDETLKKEVGKCIHFYCPLASDMEEEGFMGFSGDHRMIVHDEELLKEIRGSASTTKKGED